MVRMEVGNKRDCRRKWLKAAGMNKILGVKVLSTDGWRFTIAKKTAIVEGGRLMESISYNIIYLKVTTQYVEGW